MMVEVVVVLIEVLVDNNSGDFTPIYKQARRVGIACAAESHEGQNQENLQFEVEQGEPECTFVEFCIF